MLITPYKIKKAFLYFKHFGPREFMNHLFERLEPEEVPYGPWYESHKPDGAELDRTLRDLTALCPAVQSVAVVPVGLTRHREGLEKLRMFILTEHVS